MMKIIIEIIGSFVLATIITAIPILCGLSFALDWYGEIQWLLVIITIFILFGIWSLFLELSNKDGRATGK